MRKINQLDLFSGIGGFHLGFEKAGYKVKSYFSEVDKHAVAVYKHKFKDAEYVGSVTDVRGADLPSIDLITFGSPCQDFSLAGKRKGMGGERSSLILEAIRLIGECRPRVFIWENVKGTFSSNSGEDFAAILQAFAHIGGYRLEWQLLNTSWFLPQNRERIYLVGYSTNTKRNWRGVFPIGETSIISNQQKWDKGQESTSMRDKNSLARTLNARAAFGQGSDDTFIKVKSATKVGYEIAAVQDYRIRRLTPIECERLQGFPDNHTQYGDYDGEVKKMSNTQRYKQCGNAVTTDVVQAIAEKIKPLFK